jgi:hypothetical protein
MEHDIHSFVRKTQADLQAEYIRISRRVIEDPGTAGDQGEENWATIFREWLPKYFHIVTNGRIITDSGYVSPQIDVLVLYPSYPTILLDKKLYLSGGVAAAFECKTTLKAAHVRNAVKTSSLLKRALPTREGSPYKELHAGIIYGLLAHSHSWKSMNSKPIKNVENALWNADSAFINHPRECIDIITVSDLATWKVAKITFLSPMAPLYNDKLREIYGPNGSATTGYVCCSIGTEQQSENFAPVGSLLSSLYSELAWTFPDMRQLEEYFRRVNLVGCGQGQMRLWSIDIYSKAIRDRVYQGFLSNGAPYDEWHFGFS